MGAMRPQDEILVALPRQPPQGRRFLLRRLGDLPQAEDAPQVYAQVMALEAREATLSGALCEDRLWRRRELERLRRSVGEESGQGGTWTSFLQPVSASDRPHDVKDAGIAAGSALEAILEPLEAAVERGEREAVCVARALGQIQSRKSIELLEKIAYDHGAMVPVMAAFSTLGGELAAEKAIQLVRAVEGTALHPQLLEAFVGLPCPASFAFLREQLATGRPEVALSVAAALEGYQTYDTLPLLDALLATPDPWVLINTVETLGRIGRPEHLQRIAAVFDSQQHALIRVGCLQAISGSSGDTVFQLAEQGLASGDPNVQAAAIEAMVAAGVPYEKYRDRVIGLLNAPHPKLALNASLACVAMDPQRAVQRVTGMLGSGIPAQLLQSIHTMAYIEAASSIQALAHIVKMCPAGAMRQEAVKSLGRLATRSPEAVEHLVTVLELDDPEARETAAWFLSGAHPAGRVNAARALAEVVREDPAGDLAVVCLEALGLLGPAGQLSVPDLHHLLLTGPDQAAAAARSLAVSFPRSREAQDLLHHDSPMIQGFGGLMSWLERGAGLDLLYQALSQRAPSTFEAACEIARVAGAAGGWTAETRRLVGLAKALGAAAVDAREAAGLGRLDQSLSLPRKKIGLGIVPKGTARTRGMAPEALEVKAESVRKAESEGDGALLSHSFYETASQPNVTPSAGGGPLPTSRSSTEERSSPLQPAAPPSRPTEPSGRAPARGATQPPRPGPSRLGEAIRWAGLALLCVGAVFLGRFLKTLFH